MRIFAAFFCIACIAKGAPQGPAFQSETRVVLVDAVVTGKKGEYIRDLSAKDFRIWEDNKEQTIRSFSLETDSSATEPRRLVLFFDNTGMSTADQANMRQAAARFIDTSVGPNRLMAVVNLDDGLRVVQSFTENTGRLQDAVRGVRMTGTSSGAAPRETAMGTTEANARNLLQSLEGLAQNLNAVPGRKIIVLFTGNASAVSAAQQADVANLVQMSNRSNVAIYPVMQAAAPAEDASGNSLLFAVPRRGMNNSSNGLRGGDDSVPFTIASGTGGFVVSPSNDIVGQLQKIGAEQGQSYVLGYTPPDSKEGVCHSLRVKVDRGEVRARSSYCTAKPQDLLAESRVEQDLEKRAAAAGTGSAASIQAPFFYAAPNVARVHVTMEIATEGLKFENQKGKLHAEMNLLGIASTSDGVVAARFSDIVRRDFDDKQDLDKWKEKPLHYEKEFKIVPGQYNLTVVFSCGGASFGRVETSLAIPAYDRTQLAVSGLALGREVRPASELGLETSLIDDGTPLLAGGMQLIPAGSKVFKKPGQAFCYFEVYTPGPGEPATVTLRILEGKTGEQKWSGGAAKLDPASGGKSTIPVGLVLPIESLSSGSYRAEATVAEGAGKSVTRTVDFEIK
jgi:VWFA-related protein